MSKGFYKQTIAMCKGEYQLPLVLADIFQWLRDRYQVNPINVVFETHGTLYSQSISLVFKTKAEKDKMWAHCDEMATQFFNEIFKEENRITLMEHGHVVRLRQKKIPEAMFKFESLEQIALQLAVEECGKGYEMIVGLYPQLLWQVRYAESRFIVFYFTEQQRIESDGNGTTDKIVSALVQELSQFDTLGLITVDLLIDLNALVIDSKENYDKNFGGADWMYFR
jgi:hypothetical protein